MSDTLKIMVRTKERRALTREEAYAWATKASQLWLSNDAGLYLKNAGYIDGTYERDRTPYGSAEFHTLREATLAEGHAWHAKQIGYSATLLVDGGWKNPDEILQDKEIILEVVKGDTKD